MDSGPTLADIKCFEEKLKSAPQIVPVTVHYFADGMYCRKVWRPAGTWVVGKVHKKEHFFICAGGALLVFSEGSSRVLHAGEVLVSTPGTKRVTHALIDSVGMTVHRTSETDVEKIEKELLEDAPESLFDAYNQLKNPLLPHFDILAYRQLTARVVAAEKIGFWSDWTPNEQELYQTGKWQEFSRSRGYTEAEIAEYQAWLDMGQQAVQMGLKPLEYIQDITEQAFLKNAALDTKGEIHKSSVLQDHLRRLL